MLRVGLTGGIGAGKSAVAERLAGHGAVIVDSDRLAREVVAAGTPGFAAVVDAFGSSVVAADGALDRAAIAARVFADSEARRTLEGIIHPLVRQRSAELFAAAPDDAIVVNDVPLLTEVGLAPTYHLVIVVEATPEVRLERLVAARGMTAEEVRARIAAQASDDTRRAAADVLLDNSGSRAALHAAVDALWERLVIFERCVRLRTREQVTGPVRLAPHDPTWPAQFARVAARLALAAGPAALRIDHIGSTAVPGLPAKDILDIQLTVPSLEAADEIRDALEDAGFPRPPGVWIDWPKPAAPGLPAPPPPRFDANDEPIEESVPPEFRKRLHGSADPGRRVNLHIRVADTPTWRYALLFRDWLRANDDERDDYAALKEKLAAEDLQIGAYAEAKNPWFDAAFERSEAWAARTGWRP